jgi:hypothetical protein
MTVNAFADRHSMKAKYLLVCGVAAGAFGARCINYLGDTDICV